MVIWLLLLLYVSPTVVHRGCCRVEEKGWGSWSSQIKLVLSARSKRQGVYTSCLSMLMSLRMSLMSATDSIH